MPSAQLPFPRGTAPSPPAAIPDARLKRRADSYRRASPAMPSDHVDYAFGRHDVRTTAPSSVLRPVPPATGGIGAPNVDRSGRPEPPRIGRREEDWPTDPDRRRPKPHGMLWSRSSGVDKFCSCGLCSHGCPVELKPRTVNVVIPEHPDVRTNRCMGLMRRGHHDVVKLG